ncbi:MAG: sensor histidine kinase [Solirubrobacteraceae bacterium]
MRALPSISAYGQSGQDAAGLIGTSGRDLASPRRKRSPALRRAPALPASSASEPSRGHGRWTPASTVLVAAAGVGAVALATAVGTDVSSAHTAFGLRATIITAFAAAAVTAQTMRAGSRLGQLLGTMTLFCVLWMLNGALWAPAHAVGALLSAIAPVVLAYVMLAYPGGRLRGSADRLLIAITGGTLVAGSLAAAAIAWHPALWPPLPGCAPNCPDDVSGLTLPGAAPAALRVLVVASWLALALGTAALVLTHGRRPVPRPVRRAVVPMGVVAVAAALLTAFLVIRVSGRDGGSALDAAYAAIAVLTALAIVLGLALERLFLAGALTRLVAQLSVVPGREAQALTATALGDDSLQIVSRRPGSTEYVDASGRAVPLPVGSRDRCVTYVRRAGRPVAAVIYDAELADQERFIQAAAAAALLRVEQTCLHTDLQASMRDLERSRMRLVESVQRERSRIERDLHDGVQQQVLGLRIKLELATEMLEVDPVEGERLLAAVGRQMDTVLDAVRSLARGIYPAVLHERGLPEAIRSAGRAAVVPVTVRASHVGRYPEPIEVAVYFSCLESLQNALKHAGSGAAVVITLWERDGRIVFEVRDDGRGFDAESVDRGRGLTNMRDRLEAVGGSLRVISTPGNGTRIHGEAPMTAPVDDVPPRATSTPSQQPEAAQGRQGPTDEHQQAREHYWPAPL